MSIKRDIDLRAQLYSPEYREQTLVLLKMLWSRKHAYQGDAYFRWKYEENPYSNFPLVILCLHDGSVVGALGFMIQKLMIGGKEENICIPVDGIVHPDFRMYGVYSRMLSEGIKVISSLMDTYHFRFFFNASSNRGSAPGLVKLGWRALTSRQYMNRLSLPIWFKSLGKNRIIGSSRHKFVYKGSFYELAITKELRLKDIVTLLAYDQKPVHMVHDDVFYNWKYGFDHESYGFIYMYKDDEPVSYLIVNCESESQLSIEEYGYKNKESIKLIVSQTAKLTRSSLIRLFCTKQTRRDMRILRSLGLWPEYKWMLKLIGKKPRTPVFIKNIIGDGQDNDYVINGVNCLDPMNWRIFHADIL
jgi:hypothetical protein